MKAFLVPRTSWYRASLALFAVCALALPGCGKKTQMLSGKVLTSDGKPVTGGDIKFHPVTAEKGKEGPFLGTLSPKGEYSITNLSPGEYKVTVDTDSVKGISMTPGVQPGMKPPPGMEDKVKVDPGAMQNPAGAPVFVPVPESVKQAVSTPLKVTITGGRQSEDLKLPAS
jgi:hypothetical protein